MSTLAIVLSLSLLMYLAYRGYTVLLLAPVLAGLAVVLSGDLAHLLPIYTEVFMPALGSYVLAYFPVFLLGALFGQLMADSGAATAIAQWIERSLGPRHAILTVVLACAVLTYGGVSLFVVAFAIYPIGRSLFRSADIPKRLLAPAIALGSFTFTMTAMPGTPSIQNAIPIPYYSTTTFSAPGLGLIASALIALMGMGWLLSRAAKARKLGEGYGVHDDEAQASAKAPAADAAAAPDTGPDMPLLLALLPLLLVIGVNALFTYVVFPAADFGPIEQRFDGLVAVQRTTPPAQ